MSTKEDLIKRNYALSREIDRHRRALEAGTRRYRRELAALEDAGQEQALLQLQAVQETHEARKLARAAQRRADKLAAKLVHRAGELGRMRRVYADMFAGRNRSLEDAGKRARGLQESLRKTKAQLRAERRELERAWGQVRDLRRKLRESNRAVIMGALGGGLEVQPLSGRQHEDTTGYSPAARRAAQGFQ